MSKISQSGAVCLFVVLRFVVLVLFSTVIRKRRGKKLISKAIKYKLDSSPKMQFAFYDLMTFRNFLETYRFCRKSGNYANSRDWGGHALCVIMTQCLRKSIYDSPLSNKMHAWKSYFIHSFIYLFIYPFELSLCWQKYTIRKVILCTSS